MAENGNGKNGLKVFASGGAIIAVVSGMGGFGTWVSNKFDDINKIFSARNERITLLEYKVEQLEKERAANRKAEQTEREQAEMNRRLNALEGKK